MDINYYKRYEPIGGKWYLKEELGRGAYGVVCLVERKDYSDAKSAMKIVSIPSYPGEVERFMQENPGVGEAEVKNYFYSCVNEVINEFHLMSKLRGHSNIVSYEDHDVIEKQDGMGWDIFIRMELLTPLLKHFGGSSPSQEDVIKLGIDICEALIVCEENKIIHRDIKPGNIFVSSSGSYKLGDFGVARTLEKASGEMSKKGTYTYMAPEIYRGEEYNMTVDIYSLGIVMYKLLNNNMEPFRTDKLNTNDENARFRRMKGEKIPAPLNCSEELSAIILKACAFDAFDRYSSAREMKNDLLGLLKVKGSDNVSAKTEAVREKTPYEKWTLEAKSVLFKSVEGSMRWRCPRCDMANDGHDEQCFVCGCSRSVYIPSYKKTDVFVKDLNNHGAAPTIKPTTAPRPMTMKEMTDVWKGIGASKPPTHSHVSTDKGTYGGIVAFLCVVIFFIIVLLYFNS